MIVCLLGGALNYENPVYEAIIHATGRKNPIIGVSTTASESLEQGQRVFEQDIQDQPSYRALFEGNGFMPKHLQMANDCYEKNKDSQVNCDIVAQAHVLFFNGGDQSRHARCYLKDCGSDNELMQRIRQRFECGQLLIAGTSAGCAIQGPVTFGEGDSFGYLYSALDRSLIPKMIGEDLRDCEGNGWDFEHNGGFMKGFCFIKDAITDTHFDARGRLGRLVAAVMALGPSIGIHKGYGIGEDTGFLIDNGIGSVHGKNEVMIVDIEQANAIKQGRFYAFQGIRMHFLMDGDKCDSNLCIQSARNLVEHTLNGRSKVVKDIFEPYACTNALRSLIHEKLDSIKGFTQEYDGISFSATFIRDPLTKTYSQGDSFTISNILLNIDPLNQQCK